MLALLVPGVHMGAGGAPAATSDAPMKQQMGAGV